MDNRYGVLQIVTQQHTKIKTMKMEFLVKFQSHFIVNTSAYQRNIHRHFTEYKIASRIKAKILKYWCVIHDMQVPGSVKFI